MKDARHSSSILACAVLHSSGLGGAERSHVERALDLRTEGVLTHTLLPFPDRGLGRELEAVGLPFSPAPRAPWWIEVSERPGGPASGPPLKDLVDERSVRAFVREFVSLRPDVVLSMTVASPQAALAARVLGIPHVWFLSELAVPDHGMHPTVPHAVIGRAVEQLSDGVVCASRAVRAQFFGSGAEEASEDAFAARWIHVVPSAPRLPAGFTVAEIPREAMDDVGLITVGVIGTLIPGKGQADAVDALVELQRRGTPVRLILFGTGTDAARSELEDRAREGGVDHLLELRYEADRQAIYEAVDVIAVTSRQEGLTRVIFEASAANRPIVYAAEGSTTEAMVPEVTGLPFVPGDPRTLADALERLIEQPGLRAGLARTARTALAEFCASPARGPRLQQVLQDAITAHPEGQWMRNVADLRARLLSEATNGNEGSSDMALDDITQLRTRYDEIISELRTRYDEVRRLNRTLGRRPVRSAIMLANLLRSPRSVLRPSRRPIRESEGHGPLDDGAYARWRAVEERPGEAPPGLAGPGLAGRSSEPNFSFVMPVCDPDPSVLHAAVASVVSQRYSGWQLVIVDDASERPDIGELLGALDASGGRITVVRNAERLGIAATTERGIALTTGRWIGFIDHDDLLAADVLADCASTAEQHPRATMLFTDEDKLDADGQRVHPRFKSDFDRVRLLHENAVNHLSLFRRDLLDAIGPLARDLSGSQDWDLALRASAVVTDDVVVHVDRIGYHWRQTDGQFSRARADVALQAGLVAVQRQLDAIDVPLRARPHPRVGGAVLLEPTALSCADATFVLAVQNGTPEGLRRTAQNLRAWQRDGFAQLVVACEHVEVEERLRFEIEAVGGVANVVTSRAAGLGALLRRAHEEVRTDSVIIVDESLVPAASAVDHRVGPTLLGYLALPGVELAGPRVLDQWGLLEQGPVMLSDGRLVVSGAGVDPLNDGYFGDYALPQQVAALGALCVAISTRALTSWCDQAHTVECPNELALSLSVSTWRQGGRVAWVPTTSVRRRPRSADPQVAVTATVLASHAATLAELSAGERRIPRLHRALDVRDGALRLAVPR